ncbi:MAG: 23S rRNA (guanosine(2251)-2'-O)-methyltransferase RlmB [Eubacteriales bacterium]|nr:23S rRNA (guanosine(2251)-2'-O)-methyltransferase RlmB [Eubacteriales bacterium]MDY3332839.1 23S rRNA (guanosine(2251)-2'-O)-methyltransferase RlmB [Gallibacter sp.]
MKEEIIIGRNAVLEAINSDTNIDKILIQEGATGSIKKIISNAKQKKITIYTRDKASLDRLVDGGMHQGVVAYTTSFKYATVEDIVGDAQASDQDGIIVILDGIEDPHNLGAIIRSAECAGVNGVIIPERRSASVNATVARTSVGAVAHMKVARVTNISNTIDELKDKGYWIFGCDMGEQMYYEADMTGNVAIIIGNEGSGISKRVREKCDFIISMPVLGKVDSLNASNAAAIAIYEALRQRECK